MTIDDHRRHAPAAQRNRAPILDALRPRLPAAGLVLEVASGTGEHVVHLAAALPALEWQPSDPDAGARASIAAWTAASGLRNIRPPLALDVMDEWPALRPDAMLCINMVHISPWAATQGLMSGAGRLLPSGGPLILYGPYRREGRHTAESNAAFDADLKRRNPDWGVRDLEAVAGLAADQGLTQQSVVEMPANNLLVEFRRAG